MSRWFKILISLFALFIALQSNSQCNTDVTICEPGEAGPFTFVPASGVVGSCQDFINGTGSASYAYIMLYITESGPLSLLIDGNSGFGFIDVSIFSIPPNQDPCDAILDVNNEIGCNYASAANGCNQFGNEFPCTSSVPSPFVNAGDVLMILVEDWSGSQANFTLELGGPPNAQTGPPDATIAPAGPFNANQNFASMSAADGGGTWSANCGACIDPDSGLFNPNMAGEGTWEVCYSIGDDPCDDSDCVDVLVLPAAPGGGGDCDSEFVDSGGVGGNYGNNQTNTYTFCSDNSSQIVTLEFLSFNIENNWDFMSIYAGPDTSFPLIGTYTGTNSPGTVSSSNGCLTVVFTSDISVTAPGWVAEFECLQDCQGIVPIISSTVPVPTGADGEIDLCQGETVTFNGDADYPENDTFYTQDNSTSVFVWDFGDGDFATGQSVVHNFAQEGLYLVTMYVIDIEGCESELISQIIRVSPTPTFVGTGPEADVICLGEQNTLNGFYQSQDFTIDCDPVDAQLVSLPDNLTTYNSPLSVSCFAPGTVLTDIDDLESICIEIEHSWLGDLQIEIECPSGESVILLDYPNSGGSTYLGIPNESDSPTVVGTGYEYCFTPDAINGTLDSGTGGTVPAGDYSSEFPLTGLLGCELNGDWTISITDNLFLDNGFLFSWEVNFNDDAFPFSDGITFEPVIIDEGWIDEPTIVSSTGNSIVVEPTNSGTNCYTYFVEDDFGCVYDTVVCFEVLDLPELIVLSGPASICNGQSEDIQLGFTGVGPWTITYSLDGVPQPDLVFTENPSVISVSTAGTYLFETITDQNCTNPIDLELVVPVTTSPTATLSAPAEVCGAELAFIQVVFTGDAPWEFVYSIDNVNQPAIVTSDNPLLIPIVDGGTFIPVSVNSSGCPGSVFGYAQVEVFEAIEAALSGGGDICPGDALSLNVDIIGDAFGYFVIYSIDGVQQPAIFVSGNSGVITATVPGLYELISVESLDCPGIVSGSAIVGSLSGAEATISGDYVVCPGESVDLVIDLLGTAPWDLVYAIDGVDQPAITISSSPYLLNVNTPGVYTLTSVFDASSPCAGITSGTASYSITTNPTANISGDASICDGESTDITIVLTGTGPWDLVYAIDGTDQPLISIASSPYVITASADEVYTLTSVSDVNCDGTVSGSATITINEIPTADLSGDAAICDGESTDITINLTGNGPWDLVYAIDGVDQPMETVLSSPFVITASADEVYTLTSVSDTNCDGTVSGSATITTNEIPAADLSGDAAICDGESTDITIVLTGTGPWDLVYAIDGTDQPLISIASSPYVITASADEVYTLTSVSDTNCDGTVSGSATITTNEIPTADLSGDAAICDGESTDITINLTGNGPWDLVYAIDGVDQPVETVLSSPFVIPVTDEGTFTLTSVSDANCDGTVSGSAAITINEIPTADLSGDAAICDGESTDITIVLTGTGPWDLVYAIDGTDQPLISIASSPYVITASADEVYTLTSVSDTNCDGTVSGSATITTNEIPTADLSGDAAICDGESTDITINLTGNGPWDLVYAIDGVDQPMETVLSSPFVISTSDAGDYTLTSVSDTNCDGTVSGSATITTNEIPTADLSGDAAICDGESTDITIVLTGTGPWDLVYAIDGTDQSLISIASSPYVITASADEVYTLTSVSDVNCDGTVSGSATITINEIPTADLSGDAAICDGESTDITIVLTGTGPWDLVYAIDGVDQPVETVLSSPFVIPVTDEGTFTLTSVSDANCDGTVSGSATITINEIPTADLSGDAAICDGESTDITINLTGNGPWDLVYAIDGIDQPMETVLSSPFVISASNAGDYALTSVSDANCDGTVSGSATITINEIPTADISGDAAICDGESTDITINLTGNGPWDLVYAIDGTDQPLISIASSPYVITASADEVYTLTSVSDVNCDGTVSGSATITINEIPTADLSGDAVICDGETTDITINLTGNGPWDLVYAIDGVDQPMETVLSSPFVITASADEVYTLTSVSDANCDGTVSGSATITTNEIPTADLSGDAAICDGESTDITINLTGNGPWDLVYAIDGVDQPMETVLSSPFVIPVTDEGTFTLTSVSDANCDGTVSGSATITINEIPTADISGDASICDGESTDITIILTGTGPWDLVYAIDGVDQPVETVLSSPFVITASADEVYTLTSVSDTNCDGTVSGSAAIMINEIPTADLSGDAAICDGESTDITINLTGNGPWDLVYAIDGSDQSLISIASSPYVITASADEAYTLTSVSDANCDGTVSGSATITINEIPTADISGDASICDGESTDITIILTGTGPWDLVYAIDGVDQPMGTVLSSPFVIPVTDEGTFTLTSVSDANCDGTVSGSATITTNEIPTADASGDAVICDGESTDITIVLTGTGPWDLVYAIDGTDQPLISIASSPYVITASADEVYTLTSVSDVNCDGTVSGSAAITINEIPTADISGDAAICDGETTDITINLTGTGPWDLVYAINGLDQPIETVLSSPFVITSSTAGVYDLTSVSDVNCDGTVSGSATITTNEIPTADLSGDAAICDGESTDITINLTGNGPWDLVYAIDGVDQPMGTVLSSPFVIPVTDEGTFTLTSVSDANCDGTVSGSAIITTNEIPTADLSGDAAICDGESTDITIVLTGTGPWDLVYAIDGTDQPLETVLSSPFVITSSTAGVYDLTSVSDVNCDGTVSGSATITTNEIPTADLSGDAAICDGESTDISIVLTGTGPWDLVYAIDGVDQPMETVLSSPFVIPVTDEGTFTLTSVSDANCDGTVSGSATITINEIPTADISGDASICDGESTDITIILTGTGPWDLVYAIDGIDQPMETVLSSPFVIPVTDAGDFTLTSVSDTNCDGTVSGSATITTNEIPTADISGDAAICDGELTDITINLTGNGPWDLVYAIDGTDQPLISIASSPYVITASADEVYTLTSVSDVNCDGTVSGSATITINEIPTADLSGDAAICDGESTDITIVLTGTGPWDLEYAIDGIDQPMGTVLSSPFVIPVTDEGTFTLTSVSDANCDGTVSGSATITINEIPTADLSGDAAICDGESTDITINLTGNGPWDLVYAIDGIDQPMETVLSSPFVISASNAGDYALTSVSDANCDGTVSGSATITINEIPTADISGDAAICDGESTDITINLTGNGPWDLVYAIDGTDQPLISIASSPYVITASADEVYTLTSVSDVNCDGTVSGSATITINEIPTADLSGDAAICDGESTDITINLTGNGPWDLVYAIDGVDQPVETVLSSPFVIPVTDEGTFTLTSVSDANCDGTVSGSATITTNEIPAADLSGDAAICDGESTDITINLTGNGPWDLVYAIDGVDQPMGTVLSSPFVIPVTDEGTFTLTSVSDANCDGTVSGSAAITINEIPTADLSGDAAICDGESTDITINLTGNGPWDLVYAIDGTDQPLISIASSPYVITASADEVYTLTSVSDVNCDGTVSGSATITINEIPTADLSGDAAICDGELTDITINLTGNGPWDLVYAIDGVDQPMETVLSSPFVMLVTDEGTFTLTSVSDANCDGTVSGSATITINEIPTADLSGDAAICDGELTDITINLTGNGPWDLVYAIDGVDQPIETVLSSPFVIPATDAGDYTLTSVSDVNCNGTVSGTAEIIFYEEIEVIETIEDCLLSGIEYTVSFTVTGGDNTSYSVTGGTGTWLGDTFTSDPIASGTSYSFDVEDGNACNTINVSGTVNCDCPTTAAISGGGTVCEGETVDLEISLEGNGPWTVVYAVDGVDQPELFIATSPYTLTVSDEGLYELTSVTDANCFGTVSGSAEIEFYEEIEVIALTEDCLVSGVEYTVSFTVTGGDNSSYTVIGGTGTWLGDTFTSDPIASGTSYSFDVEDGNACNTINVSGTVNCDCPTTAAISGGGTVCEGETLDLEISLEGNGPWTVVYAVDGADQPELFIATSPYTLTVSDEGLYELTSVTDANCFGTVSGSGQVEVNSPFDPGEDEIITLCENDSPINLFESLGGNPDLGGVWTDPLGSDVSEIYDPSLGQEGLYTYTISSDGICPEVSSIIDISTVALVEVIDLTEDCLVSGVEYTVSFTVTDGDNTSYTVTGGTGTWLGDTFTSDPIASGTSYSFDVEDGNACNTINVSGTVNCDCPTTAAISGGGTVCEGETVDLEITLEGNGPWTVVYAVDGVDQPELLIATSPYTLTISDEGLYELTSVTDANCFGTVSGSGQVEVNSPFDPGEDEIITLCENDSPINLFESLGGNPDLGGVWTDPLGSDVSEIYDPSLGQEGLYTYTISSDGICPEVSSIIDISTVALVEVIDLTEDCLVSGVEYTVSFTVTDGDNTSYTVTGGTGTWLGDTFTSDPIASGTSYSFDVEDGNACNTINVSGTVNCDCPTTAAISGGGTVCEGETLDLEISLEGNGPWTVVYAVDGADQPELFIATSPYTLTVSDEGLYELTSVTDANCFGTVSGSGQVEVNSPFDPGEDEIITLCENDSPINLFESLGGNPDLGGVWTDPLGSDVSEIYDPSLGQEGLYTYTISSDGICPEVSSIIDISTVALVEVIDLTEDCLVSGVEYTVSFTVTDGDNTSYTVTGGTGTWLGDTFTSDPIASGTSYSFDVEDGNACNTINVSGTVNCDCPTTAAISGGGTVCEGETVDLEITLEGNGPWTVVYAVDGVDQPELLIATSPYTLTVSDEGLYELTSATDAFCSGPVSGSVDVIVDLPVNAGTGIEITLCENDNSVELFDQLLDFPAGGGDWYAPDGDNFDGTFDPVADLSGEYLYIIEDAGTCSPDSAMVLVNVNEEISVIELEEDCLLSGIEYVVSFEVNGGDNSSYVVNGNSGTWAGNLFTSDPISSGTSYLFEVSDANTCNLITLEGTVTCDCPAMGSISGGGEICEGESIELIIELEGNGPWIATYTIDGLNPTDIDIDTSPFVLDVSNSGVYELSAVTDANCFGTTSGTAEVIVDQIPFAGENGAAEFCEGDAESDLTFYLLNDPDTGGTWSDPLGNSFDGDFDPGIDLSGNYSYTVESAGVCPQDQASVSIQVNNEISVENLVEDCLSSGIEFVVSFEVTGGDNTSYQVDGDSGSWSGNVFTSDPIASGSDYYFEVFDDYQCNVILLEGNITCDCPAEADLSGGSIMCEGEYTDLTIELSGNGPWSVVYSVDDVDQPAIVINSSPYTLTVTDAGIYELSSVSDANCQGVVSGEAVVIVYTIPNAGEDVQIDVCENEDVIDLFELLDGDIGGIWLDPLGNEIDSNFNPALDSDGVYTYEIISDGICPGDEALITIDIFDQIEVDNIIEECLLTGIEYTVSFEVSGGDSDTYSIIGNGGTWIGNTFTSDIIISGTDYSFLISDVNSCNEIEVAGNVSCDCPAEATISGSETICVGEEAEFEITFEGNGPWEFIYATDGVESAPVLVDESPYLLVVSEPGIYTLVSVLDANCPGEVFGFAELVVHELPTANLDGELNICEGEEGALEISLTGEGPWNIVIALDGEVDQELTYGSNTYVSNDVEAGVYTVLSVEDQNCSNIGFGNFEITINELPSGILSGGGNICEGEEISLEVEFFGQGPWEFIYSLDGVDQPAISTDQSPYEIIVLETGNYVLESVSNMSCEGIAAGAVDINPSTVPTGFISGALDLCEGEIGEIEVELNGANTYEFVYALEDDIMDTIYTEDSNYFIEVSEPGSYTLVILITDGCEGEVDGFAEVVVQSLPTAEITGDLLLCEDESGDLTISLEGQAPWDIVYEIDGIEQEQISVDDALYYLEVDQEGTYTLVSVIDEQCVGVAYGTGEVEINPLPTGIIEGDFDICADEESILDINLTGNPQWTIYISQNGVPYDIIETSTDVLEYEVLESGIYTIENIVSNGCENEGEGISNVIIHTIPTALIEGDAAICEGEPANVVISFTGNPEFSLSYAIDGIAQPIIETSEEQINFSVTEEGIYTLLNINDLYCSGTVDGVSNVTIEDLPTAEISGNYTICENAVQELEVSMTGEAVWTLIYSIDGVIQPSISTNDPLVFVNGDQPGVYEIIEVSDDNCDNAGLGEATIEYFPPIQLEVSESESICEGEEVLLSGYASGGMGSSYSFEWNAGSESYEDANIIVEPLTTTEYVLTVTDNCDIPVSETVTITVNPLPDVSFEADPQVMCGTGTFTLFNTTPEYMVGGSCIWIIDGVEFFACEEVTYYMDSEGSVDVGLTVTSPYGCTNSAYESNFVEVYPEPGASFYSNPENPTILYNEVQFDNQSVGAISYEWDFDGLGTSTEENPSFEFPYSGSGVDGFHVCLVATNIYGCDDTTCHHLAMDGEWLVYVPNTFTPNSDNTNDVFHVSILGGDPFEFNLQIYNRWGEKIFETDDFLEGWDGSYRGNFTNSNQEFFVPDGTYVWQIIVKENEAADKKELRGHVNLLR